MDLPDGEPDCGPWRAVAVTDLYAALGCPRVLAVDGRSGAGKSTLVARLAAAVPGTAVVHTDDVAWHRRRSRAAGVRAPPGRADLGADRPRARDPARPRTRRR